MSSPSKPSIVTAGHPALRLVCRPITEAEIKAGDIEPLLLQMTEALHAVSGVGLAAPQLGIPWSVAILEVTRKIVENMPLEKQREQEDEVVPLQRLLNPILTPEGDELRLGFESCLSIPGYRALVPRFARVRVEAFDASGEKISFNASGWHARILQHELDHLQGNLYIDRMFSRSFISEEYYKDVRLRPLLEVAHELGISWPKD